MCKYAFLRCEYAFLKCKDVVLRCGYTFLGCDSTNLWSNFLNFIHFEFFNTNHLKKKRWKNAKYRCNDAK